MPGLLPQVLFRTDTKNEEGIPWERWILRNFSKMRVHARLSFIVTTNLPSFVRLIRCFIGRSKPLGRLEEFGQAVFDKEVKIQRSPGTPSKKSPMGVIQKHSCCVSVVIRFPAERFDHGWPNCAWLLDS